MNTLMQLEMRFHRIILIETNVLTLSSPFHCSSRVSYRRLPRTISTWVLSFSTDGDTTASLSILLDHCDNEKVFSCVQVGFHVFQFVPVASGPASGHHIEGLAPSAFIPLIKYLYTLLRSLKISESLIVESFQEENCRVNGGLEKSSL